MKKIMSGILFLTALFAVTGCSAGESTTESTKASERQTVETTGKSNTLVVTDSNGTVTVPKNPKKIVVFDNSALDTLDALGVGDRVIGAPTSNLPAYLAKYQEVEAAGGIKEPDLEKINQIQPDLIIISGRQQDYLEQLQAIAPTIFLSVDNQQTWTSIKDNVNTLATIFHKEADAKEKLAKLESRIEETKAKAKDSGKALTVLINEGQLSAFGEGSRFSILYDTFGFTPADDQIDASTHGQSVSYEYLIEKNPAILFVVDRTKAIGGDDTKNQVAENELVKQTTAGQQDKVIELSSDIWYLSGSGLESVNLMLDDVQQAIK